MFDGFKAITYDKLTFQSLLKNSRLEWIQHTNTNTGEINYSTKYKGLTIERFCSGRIQIAGSLHKYHNDGIHNWNDFTVSKLKDVLDSLQSDLDINPLTTSLNNLEYGVNINTPFAPDALINSLNGFKWKPFNIMDTIGQGYGKQCKGSSQYIIKIYNKGSQNYRQEMILRIEKKVVTMAALNFGQLKLADLLNPDLWEHCKKELINMVDDILFNEPIDIKSLTKIEQKTHSKVVNQSNWINFSRDQRKRLKKAFNEIISIHGQDRFKPIILKQIKDKFAELISA